MAGRYSSRKGKPANSQTRYLKFLAVPAVVIILVAAVMLTGKDSKIENPEMSQTESSAPVTLEVETESNEEASESASEQSEATAESTEEAMALALEKNGVAEITSLAQSYFDAKQAADAETMYKLFGRTDIDGMEKLRESLQYSARYTEGYQNVTAYTTAGPEEGSYLVYISYDLKFRDCETLAPGLFWTYVTKNAEGNYCMTEMSQITQNVLSFVNQAEQSEAVYELRSGVYEGLRTALEQDSQLAELYAILLGTGSAAEETTAVSHEINIGEVTETTTAAESQVSEPADELSTGETAGETTGAGQ